MEPDDQGNDIDSLMRRLAQKTRMPEGWRGGRFERLLEDIMTPPQHRAELPGPAPKVFTQADVDEAIRKHREDKARQSRDDA